MNKELESKTNKTERLSVIAIWSSIFGFLVIPIFIGFIAGSLAKQKIGKDSNDQQGIKMADKAIMISFIWLIVMFVIVPTFIAVPFMIRARRVAILSACEGNLMYIGSVIEEYKLDHDGHYPQNLEILEKQRYITEIPVCPVTCSNYKYEIKDWNSKDFKVLCPNPESHIGTSGRNSWCIEFYYSPEKGIVQKNNIKIDSISNRD